MTSSAFGEITSYAKKGHRPTAAVCHVPEYSMLLECGQKIVLKEKIWTLTQLQLKELYDALAFCLLAFASVLSRGHRTVTVGPVGRHDVSEVQ